MSKERTISERIALLEVFEGVIISLSDTLDYYTTKNEEGDSIAPTPDDRYSYNKYNAYQTAIAMIEKLANNT